MIPLILVIFLPLFWRSFSNVHFGFTGLNDEIKINFKDVRPSLDSIFRGFEFPIRRSALVRIRKLTKRKVYGAINGIKKSSSGVQRQNNLSLAESFIAVVCFFLLIFIPPHPLSERECIVVENYLGNIQILHRCSLHFFKLTDAIS